MPSHLDSWEAWWQLALMVNQYDGASDSKMKNLAIWSKTVVEDTGMMVSTVQFWHRPLSGCQECASPNCTVGTNYWRSDYDQPMGVLINLGAIQMNWLSTSHKCFWRWKWWGIKILKVLLFTNYSLPVTVSYEGWCLLPHNNCIDNYCISSSPHHVWCMDTLFFL
jgi:hypothetical protein